MNNLHRLVISILCTLILSCDHPRDNKTAVVKDSIPDKSTMANNEAERLKRRQGMKAAEFTDSINFKNALGTALTIAESKINSDKFNLKYVETVPDSAYDIKVEISTGYYFSSRQPHLVIKTISPAEMYINVLVKDNNRYRPVLSHLQHTLEYMKDTIQDINGDGLEDFVVNWYGLNGCCLKGFSTVYLQRPDKESFSKGFKFINPTFSPNEKIIRGICYGHPGETEMYKYKWNGERVDTVEYISYEKNTKGEKTGKVIVSKFYRYHGQNKVLRRLNDIPKEYSMIKGIAWFAGKEYER